MVLGGIQSFKLVTMLLLILPGFAGTKLYLQQVNKRDRYAEIDRFETVVVSVTVSLVGLVILYLIHWLSFGVTSSGVPLATPPGWAELADRVETPLGLLFNYLLLLTFVCGGAFVFGRRGAFISKVPAASNKIWRTLLGSVEIGTSRNVRVKTNSGDVIVGELAAWDHDPRELVLREPRVVGEDGESKEPSGARVYLAESEIARISVDEPGLDERHVGDGDTEPDEDTERLERRVDDEK
ncbi:DUF6338 family protein [Halobaculum sp. MBLA0147]|uniref:DUF6338 family protein n=1 Tax=Halobaculum sp. MBLA0147 TaxID=3079934 RepID=UPI003526B306